jgi:hypothetical protein
MKSSFALRDWAEVEYEYDEHQYWYIQNERRSVYTPKLTHTSKVKCQTYYFC